MENENLNQNTDVEETGVNEQAQEQVQGQEDKKESKKEDPKAEKKYSDEDIDQIISAKFAKWQQQKEKEIDQAKKLADMNAQEKAEFERDQLQAKLDELQRDKNLGLMAREARGMLSEQSINLNDDLLTLLVAEDADTTKNNVSNFVTLFNSAVDRAVTDKLKSKTPARMTGGKTTKADIMAIKDDTERRQKIAENLDLFN